MRTNLEYMDLRHKGTFETYIEITRNGTRKNETLTSIFVHK